MNFQIKTLFGAAVIAFATIAAPLGHAGEKGVVVIAKDGTRPEAILPDIDRIDIGAASLTLHQLSGAKAEVAYADVDHILIGADVTAVKEIIKPGEIAVWPTKVTTSVNATGLEAGASMLVHNLNGQLIGSAIAGDEGTASIDLSAAAAGVYVVSAGKHTVKVIKQ